MSLRMIAFMVLGLVFLYGLFTIGFPFLLALLTAIFLERLIGLLMKYLRVGRLTAAAFVCTFFTTVALGLTYIIGFKIVSETIEFWKRAPEYLNNANAYLQDAADQTLLFYQSLPPDIADQLQGWLETGVKGLTDNLNHIVTAISGYFLNVAKTIPSLFIFMFVYLIALYLMCFGLPRIYEAFLNLFDKLSRPKIVTVMSDLKKALLGFLMAQIILGMLTYIVALSGLLILGVDYPLAVALLLVVVEILPVLGTSAVLVPWAIYCFVTGDPHLGIGLIILLLVIAVSRRLLEPKVIGDAVGINALATLISMYVGFELIGVIGLILGPVVIIIYQALRRVGILQFNIKLG
ncbi:sporulation integral membrane protein YtvI [Paenibacillus thalictri]|uniref:Sporulation integral membrane protein YtvI n=1 Tax=Paenibacillus thalictri TaxID=2527873 RepID=A0A4Q9DNH2_9BACL|nr:sporulation integral membrane protein YtvI [Paenibacillus thalictri]TBL75085.1 sporulation integral membrane protein YtvI [Paenibacillus thalictri]